MARCPIPFVLQSPVTGSALVGDKFTFTIHEPGKSLGSGAAATIYTTETEATTTGSNVLTTDSRGSLTQGESASPAWACYWIAPATYDILISGAGLKSVYIVRDLVSAEPESVGTPLLANLAVTEPKLAAAAVTGVKLGEGTVRQETGTTQSFLSWGEITGTTGATLSGSGDFTAVKIETGKYEITWTKEKSSANYAVISTCANKNCVATVETTTAKGFIMRQFSENVAVGVNFSFVALSAS
jgi:hypothetical protein